MLDDTAAVPYPSSMWSAARPTTAHPPRTAARAPPSPRPPSTWTDLVWPRTEPGPAFQVPVAEIVDLLVETGEALKADRAGLLAEALERMVRVSPLPAEVLERAYAVLWRSFQRPGLYAQIDHELGGADVLDGWREVRAARQPDRGHPRLPAAPGAHHRRQRTRCRRDVRRARRAHQGRQPAEAALERPVHRAPRSCAPWPRWPPGTRWCARSPRCTGAAATRRWRACCSARSSSTSWSPGAARPPSAAR